MKKLILIIITFIIALLIYVNVNADEVIIPSSAIRVRVIANSNTIEDQSMKMKVKEYIDEYISLKLLQIDNVEEARTIINNEIDDLNNNIKKLNIFKSYYKELLSILKGNL